MRVSCPNCGEQHPLWECKKPRKESTAAKVGASTNHRSQQVAQVVEQGAASVIARDLSCASSNLALPVDTKGEVANTAPSGTHVGSASPAKFDKKAWMRRYMPGYMKEWRAKRKKEGK